MGPRAVFTIHRHAEQSRALFFFAFSFHQFPSVGSRERFRVKKTFAALSFAESSFAESSFAAKSKKEPSNGFQYFEMEFLIRTFTLPPFTFF
jgi:hypothetical protein